MAPVNNIPTGYFPDNTTGLRHPKSAPKMLDSFLISIFSAHESSSTGTVSRNDTAKTTQLTRRSMKQKYILYQSDNGPCPYLPDRRWMTHSFYADTLSPAFYECLTAKGFRRSGQAFYQNHCPDCAACLPIRINVQRFSPSRSQRRVLTKNLDISYTRCRAVFESRDFELYAKYLRHRHPESPNTTREGYVSFLIESPIQTEIMRYHLKGHLVGLGWIDLMPTSLSSVYFAFDPEFSSRSLGTYSILQQIKLAQRLGKEWLQLGFWVAASQKMSYKRNFRPCEILVRKRWKELSG
ncbi:arginyltransferase [candidate division KSB3 bacterium]|uniref:Aspartate/glutamate leucyltransferase n=1 Tax=candidate division KSB3 bacterium TaxID=2044937 RepID=A0A2G6E0Y2_9BACT|nr:MAG: arginyltransferase [candidate division KSB3 bacterium]PIE28418.1 MAG: arginyltransferase [candidate division KSB3 bacterium]